MKIKIMTCHDVYNAGASLQAYALSTYLRHQGHEVENIDYKPIYLQHYRLMGVTNPTYDRPILREIYQILKFPERVKNRFSKRKKVFDDFTEQYLTKTERSYTSIEELKHNVPEADLYIAGSDQIWNPLFQNGKDPAFFLQFVPKHLRKISYAASFAVDCLSDQDTERMKMWLHYFDAISVREKSGIALLKNMDLEGIQVCDPVFLISESEWKQLAVEISYPPYLFVYDFDYNCIIQSLAEKIAKERGLKIVSVFSWDKADYIYNNMGPREFLGAICGADVVISNSFHATAFSVIFHKEFYVFNRKESINRRMEDFTEGIGLKNHLISSEDKIEDIGTTDWEYVDEKIRDMIILSKAYLKKEIEITKNS